MSARTIPPSRRSITGLFPSRKNDGLVPFESALERDFILLLEFSPSVDTYQAQPVKISYRSPKGRQTHGYPDILVTYQNGTAVLYDVKYRNELRDKWPTLRPRLKAAMEYARARGWRYHLHTEREIRTPYLENARLLLPYAYRAPDPAHEELIMTKLWQTGRTTIEKLLEECCAYEWNRAQIIPTMWCLIGRRNIVTNLDQQITVSSVIWSPTWTW